MKYIQARSTAADTEVLSIYTYIYIQHVTRGCNTSTCISMQHTCIYTHVCCYIYTNIGALYTCVASSYTYIQVVGQPGAMYKHHAYVYIYDQARAIYIKEKVYILEKKELQRYSKLHNKHMYIVGFTDIQI